MLSLIQKYAPTGPAVGSVSLDFATKLDGMAWSGKGAVKPQWQSVQMLFWLFGTGLASLSRGITNRICKAAVDWQTEGIARDGRGLNSPSWPDLNRLAIQTQAGQLPRHQCQSLQLFDSYVEASATLL